MLLSESYLYCPRCGEPRAQSVSRRPFTCHNCGHTTYFGPVTAVGGIVTDVDRNVLLIKRAKPPGQGLLGMPGGFIDQGETAEHALQREIKEEVGLHVVHMHYLMSYPNSYEYQGIILPVTDLFFHVPLERTDQLQVQESEVAGVLWTKLSDNVLENLAFVSNRKALEFFQSLTE